MSSRRCFKDNCQNKLFGKCDCGANVAFCLDHRYDHMLKPSSKRHHLIQLYFKPAEEIKHPVIQKLKELKYDIKIYKKQAIENTNKITKSLNEAFGKHLNQVGEVEKRISKIIQGLRNEEKFLDSEDDIESVLKLDIQRANIKMTEWRIDRCCLDYKEIKAAISKTYEIPFNPFKATVIDDEVESNELSFFRHCTSEFTTINLDNFQISSSSPLLTQENIHGYTPACILPDKTYFYCCNPNSSSGMVFTIDKSRKVKQLEKSKVNSYLSPVYCGKFIYLLGGYNKLAERFDLEQNMWQSMAPLPQDLRFNNTCNALFGDFILISDYYIPKIIYYSITQDNYGDIPNLVLENDCYKFMFRGNNRIYLFEKGKRIFESAKNDISKWTHIGSNSQPINGHHQSALVHYKKNIYYIGYDSQLWKFDLSSKKLSQVKTF